MTETKTMIHAGNRGLELHSLDDMWRFAQYVSGSGLAPKGMETPEAVLVAMQMGAELGLTPMASLQNVAVINGRPSVWGDAQLAVCRSSGLFDESAFDEHLSNGDGNLTASCTVRRLPNGKEITRRFAMSDAQRAGLAGKGPWQQYPHRMLQMRARSWALRDAFSDVLRGMLSAEEARDIPQDRHPSENLPENATRGLPRAEPRTLDDIADADQAPATRFLEGKNGTLAADRSMSPEAVPPAPAEAAGDPDYVPSNVEMAESNRQAAAATLDQIETEAVERGDIEPAEDAPITFDGRSKSGKASKILASNIRISNAGMLAANEAAIQDAVNAGTINPEDAAKLFTLLERRRGEIT